MSESLFALAIRQQCEHLLAIRKSGDWRRDATSFDTYCKKRWSLSKTRAKLLCDFAVFCRMAQDSYMRVPDSPDNIRPLLALPQRRWLDVWTMVLDYAREPVSASSLSAILDHLGIVSRNRMPSWILNGKRVRKAAETLADLGDGEKLVDEIGPQGLGQKWDKAVKVVIEADQRKWDERG